MTGKQPEINDYVRIVNHMMCNGYKGTIVDIVKNREGNKFCIKGNQGTKWVNGHQLRYIGRAKNRNGANSK